MGLGLSVGAGVGLLVGDGVGGEVGALVGAETGFAVGIRVGLGVGLGLGRSVGAGVVWTVGLAVGDALAFSSTNVHFGVLSMLTSTETSFGFPPSVSPTSTKPVGFCSTTVYTPGRMPAKVNTPFARRGGHDTS